MDDSQYFHHYTDITILALILKNRRIRFNRLDHVDDIQESGKYGRFYLSQYIFVSCWTFSDEENLALWHMYSKGNSGIIISLPKDPFLYKQIEPHPLLNIRLEGQIFSFLPIEKIFTNKYMVNATSFLNKNNFIKKIEYVDDIQLKSFRAQSVKNERGSDGKLWFSVAGPTTLAGYKSLTWSFQNEVRYILMVYPTPPIPEAGVSDSKWISEVPVYVQKALSKGIDIGLEYMDIDIDPIAIDKIRVTLSPFATESEKIIVDALLEKYTLGGKSLYSHLSNRIRQRKK